MRDPAVSVLKERMGAKRIQKGFLGMSVYPHKIQNTGNKIQATKGQAKGNTEFLFT